MLKKLPQTQDKNLLVGVNTADDAGVYKISDDVALIQTVDFFTPVVDDPYTYGQISAANSLSDVYAMGGKPVTALNIVGYHPKVFSKEVLVEILTGGFDKVTEAGVALVGGHTIMDEELKYGLSVTGIIHPDKIVTNAGARPGDRLVLTKPLGTGILSTAIKSGVDLGILNKRLDHIMMTLNKTASEVMQEVGVHAATDITGFGLLGHGYAMCEASKVGMKIFASQVPHFAEAIPLVKKLYVPGGTYSNQVYLEDKVVLDNSVDKDYALLLFDAQTSGGLLISVSEDKVDLLTSRLVDEGVETVAVIGEVISGRPAKIEVKK